MKRENSCRIKAFMLLISLAFSIITIGAVQARTTYYFIAAISPSTADTNQLSAYSMTVTNTGNSTLGSVGVAIPAGFTVTLPTILSPLSAWDCILSDTTINLTANHPSSAISQGESIVFTFNATAPAIPDTYVWTTEATTNPQWGGTKLTLESVQPSVNVKVPFYAPEISASKSIIDQSQTSVLSQLANATGGTLPYLYQWQQSFEGGSFSPIAGGNGPEYSFSTTTYTSVGAWSFRLDVTDSSVTPVTVSSNTVTVIVKSALAAPVITATPSVVYENQISTLTASPITTGTPPYTYQWFQKAPDGDYITVGDNAPSYIFVGSATSGTWTFLLQLSDSALETINSSAVDLTVTSLLMFTVTVNPGAHGSISPSGTVTVTYGSSQSFTISADTGYHIVDVLADGISVGAVTSYTFNNIISNHTISATFAGDELAIYASAGAHGSISPSGTVTVTYGSSQSFTISADTGYHIVDVLADGISVGAVTSYTFNNINVVHTISVTLEIDHYVIDAEAGPGGTINPTGMIRVDWNATVTFTIASDSSHFITDVFVDGDSIGPITSYTFARIESDHNITANFATGAAFFVEVISSHGSPTPSAQVNPGDDFTVSVMSPEGDLNHRWICTGYSVDEGGLTPGSSYNFVNVQANHTIAFSWQEQYYFTVTSSDGTTTGSGWYNSGDTATAAIPYSTITTQETQKIFAGWSGDATGIETTSNPITINGPKTAVANWKTRYYLSVLSEYGNPTGQGWYDAGSEASFSVNTPISADQKIRIIFNGWTSAPGAYTGTATAANVTMNGPVAERATWMIQYQITYTAIGNLLQVSVPSTEWVNAGAAAAGTFPASITNAANDTRCIFLGDNRPGAINDPITVTGTYQTQFLVTFSQSGIDSEVSGTVITVFGDAKTSKQLPEYTWVDSGDLVTFSFAATVGSTSEGKQYLVTATNCTSPLAINEPTTIHADFRLETESVLNSIMLVAAALLTAAMLAILLFAWRRRQGTKKITPIASVGGSISPNTPQKIESGGDSTIFIISAHPGYKIADVIIDNVIHLGAVRTHKFVDVKENHTISAKFHKN